MRAGSMAGGLFAGASAAGLGVPASGALVSGLPSAALGVAGGLASEPGTRGVAPGGRGGSCAKTQEHIKIATDNAVLMRTSETLFFVHDLNACDCEKPGLSGRCETRRTGPL